MQQDDADDLHAYQTICAWLAQLPPETTILWGDDSASVHHPYATRWVDVNVLPEQAPRGLNWVWTIEEPTHAKDSTPSRWVLAVPFDLDVYELSTPETEAEGPLDVVYVPSGTPLSTQDAARIAAVRDTPGGACLPMGGWTMPWLSTVLTAWIERATGRTDLRMQWHPDITSPLLAVAEERFREMDARAAAGEPSSSIPFEDLLAELREENPEGPAAFDASMAAAREESRREMLVELHQKLQRWEALATRESAFQWVTPAEVDVFLRHVDPSLDPVAWCAEHEIRNRPDVGAEPRYLFIHLSLTLTMLYLPHLGSDS